MKCQRCKEREATVQIMQQIAGKKPQTFFLCETCAREMGISIPSFTKTGKAEGNPFASIWNLFPGSFDIGAETEEIAANTCPTCNTSIDEFKKTGFLGCPDCYTAFAEQLDPIFLRTQMGKKHVGHRIGEHDLHSVTESDATAGSTASSVPPSKKKKAAVTKTPAKINDEESEELAALERLHMERVIADKKVALERAVADENYLQAARLRDEIRDLTEKKEGESK